MNEAKKIRVLTAARSVFLRYGYRRVNMNEIAEAAGMSRPALYLLFRNREEIFASVLAQWIDETLTKVAQVLAMPGSAQDRITNAFEFWAVQPFEMAMTSPEAKELIECSFDFAQDALQHGYDRFEAALVPVLSALPPRDGVAPAVTAHILTSAVRGFKQAATSPDDLRQMIGTLLTLTLREPANASA